MVIVVNTTDLDTAMWWWVFSNNSLATSDSSGHEKSKLLDSLTKNIYLQYSGTGDLVSCLLHEK